MSKLTDLTTSQIRRIIVIKEQIEALQGQIESIVAGGGVEIPVPTAEEAPVPAKRKYLMSASHKRKLVKALAKARRIRWARAKGTTATLKPTKQKDRRSSPATNAKLAAAARARWAKVRAEGKTTL
jgi:hypothetical protein